MLTVDTIPLRRFQIFDFRSQIAVSGNNLQSEILNLKLFCFLMISVLATTATELTKLQPVRRGLFILSRDVIAVLTNATLKNYVISRHNSFPISNCQFPICSRNPSPNLIANRQLEIGNLTYSTTSDTVPAPTVRPPSRIAKRIPFSIAIGAINSISIATLSPGITISTPAGKLATPVTSVVRK